MGTPPENIEPTTTVETVSVADAGEKPGVTPQQLAIVLGVLAVVLLGLVYFFFLRGGDEETVPPPPTAEGVPAPEETAPPEDDEAGEDDGDAGQVENFDVFAPRDPFIPLVSQGGAGGDTTGGDTGGDIGGDTGGDTGEPTDPGGDTGGSTDPGDDGETVGDHRVKVVDVYSEGGEDRAQIQVDGSVYTVDEGESFANNFELVSASGQCATILFGDDEFTLCEGEEILK